MEVSLFHAIVITKVTYDEQEVHTAILPRGVVHLDEVPGSKPTPKVFCVHVDLL